MSEELKEWFRWARANRLYVVACAAVIAWGIWAAWGL
jgi:hypothetical protein